jgi:hypothetical protein
MKIKIVLGIVLFSFSLSAQAQYTHTLRGTVIDQVLHQPLPAATVTITGTGRSVTTDQDGVFRFGDIQVGSYNLTISYAGFKPALLENITVNAGKETILTIPLEAIVRIENEIVIKANSKKINH